MVQSDSPARGGVRTNPLNPPLDLPLHVAHFRPARLTFLASLTSCAVLPVLFLKSSDPALMLKTVLPSSLSIVCLTRVWQSLLPLFCDKTFELSIQTWQTC